MSGIGVLVEEALAVLRQAQAMGPAVLTTSFGAEDMVLLDLIAANRLDIAVATLDTGRLPPETYEVWQAAETRYRRRVVPYFPKSEAVEQYVRINGINAFYDSVAQRKECCAVRKVEPLRRALAGHTGWVTGLRRGQSQARGTLEVIEWDPTHALTKFNPLVAWTESEVWDYLRARDVPVNPLHARGYPSIGCAPCTRAIDPGEDVRAGRWWWEEASGKECGLHVAETVTSDGDD